MSEVYNSSQAKLSSTAGSTPSAISASRVNSSSTPDDFIDAEIPKVLARNTACHQCRKKKLVSLFSILTLMLYTNPSQKCNAQKPICSNCQKPRVRASHKSDDSPEAEACTWDGPKEPSARTRRRRESAKRQAFVAEEHAGQPTAVRAKKAKLAELEDRIANCHGVLEGSRQTPIEPLRDSSYSVIPQDSIISINSDILSQPLLPGKRPYTYQHPPFSLGFSEDIHVYPESRTTAERHWGTVDASLGQENVNSQFERLNGAARYATDPKEVIPDTNQSQTVMPASATYEVDYDPDLFAGFPDLIWPDWPKDLPKFEIIEHLVTTFFSKVPTLPKMLNRRLLLQNLLLPPSHSDFPARPLLHAICAVTSNFVSETALATRAYFPIGTSSSEFTHPTRDFEHDSHASRSAFTGIAMGRKPEPTTPLSRFQLWHRRKAFESFFAHVDRGDRLLQCIQSYIITTAVDQYNAWWTDMWMETGALLRMATPMRLNESPNSPDGSLRRHGSMLMAPASSDWEQAERDRTWWSAYMLERGATMSTTWASSLDDDEITVELPALQSTFDNGFGDLTGIQTLHSPDLFTSHPPRHRDSFCLLVKSIKLHTEVNRFLRQYGRGSHNVATYLSNPTFRVLLSQINAFKMSFPPEFRRPTHFKTGEGAAALDRDLIQALWIMHAASICLGEPLITNETWTEEGARMTLAAIRAALSLLYDIIATSYDLTLFSPQCSFVWCLASRGLLRFIDAAIQSGDLVSGAVFRSEIEVFRLAMQRYGERFPIGNRHLKMIDDVLAQQEGKAPKKKSYAILYDCSKEDAFETERTVGANFSETASSTMFTPGQSDGLTPDNPIRNQPFSILMDPDSQLSNKGSDGGTVQTSLPTMTNVEIQDNWDINSFSFDVDAVASLFEATGAVFDVSQFQSMLQ
ncbi:uncharacterized protein IL334_001191 [Kwoniella shivajii]|uniref:Xylanolytic transcriptional activator regulatory domain-containing protein n=1 Tax=Kwoniella shivajii TaxID=564305 RepID=A0ABZ1CRL2_9TREE|nr:hypothetical protein IL334_001191 [Kwoniella shivajii]